MARVHDHSATRVRIQGDCRHPYLPSEPSGYLNWHAWAERKAKTHEQRQCPECSLWVVWIPKAKAPPRGQNVSPKEAK